jgi:hypothetical protein
MHSELIIAPAAFTLAGFIVWTLVAGWQRHYRLKVTNSFNTKLLDRIGSIKDLNEFLQTESGAQFMDNLTVERQTMRPQEGILRAIQIGIVLVTLSLGFLGLRWYFAARYAAVGDDFEILTVVGAIALSLGVGFLISAAASYRLARTLGVLDGRERGTLNARAR